MGELGGRPSFKSPRDGALSGFGFFFPGWQPAELAWEALWGRPCLSTPSFLPETLQE